MISLLMITALTINLFESWLPKIDIDNPVKKVIEVVLQNLLILEEILIDEISTQLSMTIYSLIKSSEIDM